MRLRTCLALASLAIAGAAVGPGCANGTMDSPPPGSETVTTPSFFGDWRTCVGLECRQLACPHGGTTTLVGNVVTPREVNPDPLYNALVYIPNGKVDSFAPGVTCDRCVDKPSGEPLVMARTGFDGRFELQNVPVGDDVPLVVQVGRWRRIVNIPHVTPCATTKLPTELTRLPRNKKEGDIPHYAIATGAADALECVLRKVGVSDSEFTTPDGPGRIHMWNQNGAIMPNIPPASTLWGDLDRMREYDAIVFDCEGQQYDKPADAKERILQYTAEGGRIFASHYSYVWLYDAAPFSGTAQWDVDQGSFITPQRAAFDTTFSKGEALYDWMNFLGLLEDDRTIPLLQPRRDVDIAHSPAQRWLYTQDPVSLQQYTFNTPVGAPEEQLCGRVAFSDFHVTQTDLHTQQIQWPGECQSNSQELSPEERVLEFMFFDLAACIEHDGPKLPPVPLK